MYPLNSPEVIVLKRVKDHPLASIRLDRMLHVLDPRSVTELDDAGLAALVASRGWDGPQGRTGQHHMTMSPALVFGTFRWLEAHEFEALEARYPALRSRMLLGQGPWNYRDHMELRREHQMVCQSAWEFHCAFGCLHACDYCHVPPFFNIMLNLEELASRIRAFGDTIPGQKLYKFDNYTDTITLEPEYGASEVMVNLFADWPDRNLLLYTKSDNVEHLLGLEHNGHTLISWSLNCDTACDKIEKGTPTADQRIAAIARCQEAGYPVRVRISPMCPVVDWREEYEHLVARLLSATSPEIISIDVIGWMHPSQMLDALDMSLFNPVYAREVRRLADSGFRTKGKHLFAHAMRADILRHVLETIKRVRPDQPVSLCNETAAMWRELGPLTHMTPGAYACCCGPDSVPGHPLLGTTR